jgi:WD40 repeat protein
MLLLATCGIFVFLGARKLRGNPEPVLVGQIEGKGPVNRTDFSADGDKVAVFGPESISIYDAGETTVLDVLPAKGILALSFSPKRHAALAEADPKAVEVWDTAAQRRVWLLKAHTAAVSGAAFSSDGKSLATESEIDGTVRIWNLSDGQLAKTVSLAKPARMCFSPDGERLAVAASAGITIFDARTAAQLGATKEPVEAFSFSPDGRKLLASDVAGTSRVWDSQTGNLLYSLPTPALGDKAICANPDGKHLVTGGATSGGFYSPTAGNLTLWDANTGAEIRSFSISKSSSVKAVRFSADGSFLIAVVETGSKEHRVHRYDVREWRK